jgi:hypothetical protein
MRKFAAVLLCLFTALFWTLSARADAYHAKPKLVVALVLNLGHVDYLGRYRDDFKAASGLSLTQAIRPEGAASERTAAENQPQ